jgi:DNA replication protein DnaC
MTDDLDQLLKNLRLTALADVVERELERAQKQKLSYEAFYARILREQYHLQRQRSVEYRIECARMPERWSLETFPFHLQPGVHEPTIRQLAELNFIAKRENLVFIGKTGVGKTGLASALLLKALENGYRGLFIKAQDLFDDMLATIRFASRGRRCVPRRPLRERA